MIACFWLPQFGIAVERARLNHLWGEAVGLTTDAGTLAAVSEEAAPFGIQVGHEACGARVLCPNLHLLPYDRPAYEDAARLMWDLFAIETSFVEPVSPEVCYLDLTGSDVPARVQKLARDLSVRVRVPVHAGLASTKFVALRAAMKCGDGGVLTIQAGLEAAFLARVPIDCLPKLDHKLYQKLQRLGVRTLADVTKISQYDLRRQFRGVGLLLERLASGKDGDRVKPLWPPRNIEHTVIFEDEVCDSGQVFEALRRCADCLSESLRSEYCRALTLLVTLADNSVQEQSERLSVPHGSSIALYRDALRLLGRITIEQPVTEVCLRASDLDACSGSQLALLDESRHLTGLPHERLQKLETTLAYLRKRFGPGAVMSASLLRQAKRIGLWTYPLGHLLHESVEVAVDKKGQPVRFWRRGHKREVTRIQNRWKETEWVWGSVSERMVFRVETDPSGLSELHRLGVQWRIGAVAD